MFVYIDYAFDIEKLTGEVTNVIKLEQHKLAVEKWLDDHPAVSRLGDLAFRN